MVTMITITFIVVVTPSPIIIINHHIARVWLSPDGTWTCLTPEPMSCPSVHPLPTLS